MSRRAICVRVDDDQYADLTEMAARLNDSVPGVLMTAWALLQIQESVTASSREISDAG